MTAFATLRTQPAQRCSMIKCVFFDYDGVLTTDRTGSITTCRFLSKRTGIPLERIQAALVPHNRALTLGLTTYEQVWPDFCATIGRTLPLTLLLEAFESTPANPAMFELAETLRTQCRVGIITDNKSDRMRRLRLCQNLDRLFDPIVISADLGCSKESRVIFEHALALVGLAPGQALFVDNDLDNVAVASRAGMHAIHFDDSSNDVAMLARQLRLDFGLLAGPPN